MKFVCGSQGSRIYRFVMTHWMVSGEGRGSPRCKFGVVTLVHRIICFTWPGTASVPPFHADLSLNVLLRQTLFTAFSWTPYLHGSWLGRTVSFICFCFINYSLFSEWARPSLVHLTLNWKCKQFRNATLKTVLAAHICLHKFIFKVLQAFD